MWMGACMSSIGTWMQIVAQAWLIWKLSHSPFLLGLVLGPQMEEYFRRAMLLSRGDAMVFLQRPISLGLLVTTAILLVLMALPNLRKAREEAFTEEET